MKNWTKSAGLIGAWLLIFAAFSLRLPETFPTATNLETISRQTIITGFAAVGMTFIILTGAIDLSVGSLVALVTVVIATLIQKGVPPGVAALAGLLTGVVAGGVNWGLQRGLKVGSFIVTLATLLAFRGLAKGLANENSVTVPLNWLRGFTAALPAGQKWMLLPSGGWLVLVAAGLATLILHRTVFGRHVVAVGSNPATARMCGVNVDRVQLGVFLGAGLCFGLAGLMQFSRLTIGDPTVAGGLELSVIAAVVIGGASLNGGEGSIAGSLIGALIMTTIATGASQMGLPNWVQEIVTGVIILGAVALDRWRHARLLQPH